MHRFSSWPSPNNRKFNNFSSWKHKFDQLSGPNLLRSLQAERVAAFVDIYSNCFEEDDDEDKCLLVNFSKLNISQSQQKLCQNGRVGKNVFWMTQERKKSFEKVSFSFDRFPSCWTFASFECYLASSGSLLCSGCFQASLNCFSSFSWLFVSIFSVFSSLLVPWLFFKPLYMLACGCLVSSDCFPFWLGFTVKSPQKIMNSFMNYLMNYQ